MPDATRLLDRMEEAGLISRERSSTDRRMVVTLLTTRGREPVDALDAPVDLEHERLLGHLDDQQLQALTELSTLFRQQLG
jgi:DNA-binding MarR family transcriptional regulator